MKLELINLSYYIIVRFNKGVEALFFWGGIRKQHNSSPEELRHAEKELSVKQKHTYSEHLRKNI